eukprot:11188210-Lingulodinium_polyedra.AAC.1
MEPDPGSGHDLPVLGQGLLCSVGPEEVLNGLGVPHHPENLEQSLQQGRGQVGEVGGLQMGTRRKLWCHHRCSVTNG